MKTNIEKGEKEVKLWKGKREFKEGVMCCKEVLSNLIVYETYQNEQNFLDIPYDLIRSALYIMHILNPLIIPYAD